MMRSVDLDLIEIILVNVQWIVNVTRMALEEASTSQV
jgi:hypothetical protein